MMNVMNASFALTAKQARFVEEYLVDLNATQAAIRAGYSKHTAKAIGHENLTKPDIAQAVSAAQDQRSLRTEITQDWVLTEIRDTYLEARALKHLPAANQALQLIGRHLGMFTDRIEIDLKAQILQVSAELGLNPVELEAEVRRLSS